MEQQTVELKVEGEQVGSHADKDTTYTLYSVGDDLYVAHVEGAMRAGWRPTVAKDSAKRC